MISPLFLAQTLPSLYGLGTILLGGGGVGVLCTLLMRGLWVKHGEPEIITTVAAWYSAPAQTEARVKFIKQVIDNEIRRDDGLIAKEIEQAIDDFKQKLEAELAELYRDNQTEQQFRNTVISEIGRLKGSLGVLTRSSSTSVDNFAAVSPPAGPKGPDGTGGWKKKA